MANLTEVTKDKVNAATATSASFSVTSGDLIVVVGGTFKASAGTTDTAISSTLGITWTEVTSPNVASFGQNLSIFYGTAGATSPGTVTVSATGAEQVFYVVYKFAVGTWSAVTNTTSVVRDYGGTTPWPITMTYGSAPATDSICISAVLRSQANYNRGTGDNIYIGSGWTAELGDSTLGLYELAHTGGSWWEQLGVQSRTGSASTDASWTQQSGEINEATGVAVEIKAAWAGATLATSNEEHGTSLGSANAQVLPTGSASGDLVLYIVGNDTPSTTALSGSAGWTQLSDQVQGANVIKSTIFARVLDGTTGSNILSVTGAAQDYVSVGLRITGHGCTNATLSTDLKIAGTTGATGNADPPSNTLGSSKAWLLIAAAIVDLTTSSSVTAMPAGYTVAQNVNSANSTSSVAVAVASKTATASTEDAGTFTNSSRAWIAYSIAVPPPAAPTTIPLGNFFFAV